MKPEIQNINPEACIFCGEPCTNGDKIVEVKYRLKSKVYTGKDANWTKAHLDCAKKALYENERIPPRKIRSVISKRRIQPTKRVKPWTTPRPERGVERGSN